MLKIKQIGMLLVTMSAMLVLFAGCGDKDDGGDKESLATLVAETVSSSTTTNKISTQGPSGITFEATIVSQGGDAEWCSFDLNKQVSSAGGNVGDPAYLYLDKNNSDDDRTARIEVRILPPWWLSWWAYLIYGVLVAVVIVVAYNLTLTKMKLLSELRLEKLERLNL